MFLGAALALAAAGGCNGASRPTATAGSVRPADPRFQAGLRTLEEPGGFWHTLKKGETFYALSRQYGIPPAAVAAANPQLNPASIPVGTRILIPGSGALAVPPAGAAAKPAPVKTPDRGRLRHPVLGAARESKGPTPGLEFASALGATVVAADSGLVVAATSDLGGLGPTVIVDHGKGRCTVYARLADYAVRPGDKLARGEPLGRSGAAGLLFRVYEGPSAHPPGSYLDK